MQEILVLLPKGEGYEEYDEDHDLECKVDL
jgi:hypothetical protein